MNSVPTGSPLHAQVKQFIHQAWGSRSPEVFPGPHPVSIERKHLGLLRSKQYVVCEKTDGIRYFLVCLEHEGRKYAVFVNRKLDMSTTQLAMPKNTLLDGELIGDTFLIFDSVLVNGVDTRRMNYIDRLKQAEIATKGPKMGIKLRVKTMWPMNAVKDIWQSDYPYAIDGLIFTPVDEPIRMETHETMFKWKPHGLITVDFAIDSGWLCVWDRAEGMIKVQKATFGKSGDIVECGFANDEWVPIKYREDKSMPNNRRTMMRTMINLRENIMIEEFLNR